MFRRAFWTELSSKSGHFGHFYAKFRKTDADLTEGFIPRCQKVHFCISPVFLVEEMDKKCTFMCTFWLLLIPDCKAIWIKSAKKYHFVLCLHFWSRNFKKTTNFHHFRHFLTRKSGQKVTFGIFRLSFRPTHAKMAGIPGILGSTAASEPVKPPKGWLCRWSANGVPDIQLGLQENSHFTRQPGWF